MNALLHISMEENKNMFKYVLKNVSAVNIYDKIVEVHENVYISCTVCLKICCLPSEKEKVPTRCTIV